MNELSGNGKEHKKTSISQPLEATAAHNGETGGEERLRLTLICVIQIQLHFLLKYPKAGERKERSSDFTCRIQYTFSHLRKTASERNFKK